MFHVHFINPGVKFSSCQKDYLAMASQTLAAKEHTSYWVLLIGLDSDLHTIDERKFQRCPKPEGFLIMFRCTSGMPSSLQTIMLMKFTHKQPSHFVFFSTVNEGTSSTEWPQNCVSQMFNEGLARILMIQWRKTYL